MIIGCAYYAKSKGHEAIWGLMGLASFIGLVMLYFLKDKTNEIALVGTVNAGPARGISKTSMMFLIILFLLGVFIISIPLISAGSGWAALGWMFLGYVFLVPAVFFIFIKIVLWVKSKLQRNTA
jgi:hypothetical protein